MEKYSLFEPYLNSLQSKAFDSTKSLGRRFVLNIDDDVLFGGALDPFMIDEGNGLQGKAYRRLFDKTQVFPIHSDNNHIRNRGIHTVEVAVLAKRIATILGLNVNLACAIANYHDAGHTPYGHLGEQYISDVTGKEFRHDVMSVIYAQKIERGGEGLNFLWEVLEGILNHSSGNNAIEINHTLPLEYGLVMLADKIAYTFSDLNDALRLKHFRPSDLPPAFNILGHNQRERVNKCLLALVKESSSKGFISFEESGEAQLFKYLRQWSFDNFYLPLNADGGRQKAYSNLEKVNNYFNNCDELNGQDPLFALALLTDTEANKIAENSRRLTKRKVEEINKMSFMEIVQRLPAGNRIDIFNSDLKKEDFIYAA